VAGLASDRCRRHERWDINRRLIAKGVNVVPKASKREVRVFKPSSAQIPVMLLLVSYSLLVAPTGSWLSDSPVPVPISTIF
jgi:hypothetical protein